MRAERFRLWLEAISATAVIVTLGLVTLELRASTAQAALNTRALEVAAYQDLISQISDLSRISIENPDFVELRVRAAANPLPRRGHAREQLLVSPLSTRGHGVLSVRARTPESGAPRWRARPAPAGALEPGLPGPLGGTARILHRGLVAYVDSLYNAR